MYIETSRDKEPMISPTYKDLFSEWYCIGSLNRTQSYAFLCALLQCDVYFMISMQTSKRFDVQAWHGIAHTERL